MSVAPPSGAIFEIGEVINNTYRVESILGRGGTSEVYKVRSETSGRVMALKVLRAEFSGNDDYTALMTREETIRDLRHPAIVQYFDTQRTNQGLVYLVMDYVDGPGLDEKLKSGGMDANALLTVAERISEGLDAAHTRNIIHRDLSPDNIILRGGDPADAIIIDFGIAKDTNPGAETIIGSEFAGKYSYAAPEQLSGTADARSDIYALGALLLATFRGEALDVGSNPAEIIENKARPLDVSGVPDRLAGLISRATDPDPAARFQSARDVLAYLRNGSAPNMNQPVAALDDLEKTVVRPAPGKPGASAKPSRGGLYVALLGLVLVAAGAAAYFLDLLSGTDGAEYTIADPFTFTAERLDGQAPTATGHIQSTEAQAELEALLQSVGGASDLELASGDVPSGWSADVIRATRAAIDLPEWRVSASGNRLSVVGTTDDPNQLDALHAALSPNAGDWSVEVTDNVTLKLALLPIEDVQAVMANHQTCGPLRLVDPPAGGYPGGATISVTGDFAGPADAISVDSALREIAGAREVSVDPVIRNAAICTVEPILPGTTQEAGIAMEYTYGQTGLPNLSGSFRVGENPVMDLVIPGSVRTGFLYVTVIDASGTAFHLLPNQLARQNDVAALRAGVEGPVTLRLAHPLVDASNDRLAFTVDGETELGLSLILIYRADSDIFAGLRPTSESVESFADAFEGVREQVISLDRAYLTTTR